MQTRFRFLLMASIAAIFIFSSCSKTNKQGRYIPNNAAIAVIVNGESLSNKLPWSDIKQTEWFKMIYSDSTLDAFVKTVLDNPENTGIDTRKDLIFFAVKDSINGYIVFEGTIKDEAGFRKFLGSVSPGTKETEKDGVKLLTAGLVTASWKDNRFVIAGEAPFLNPSSSLPGFGNTDDSAVTLKATPRDMTPVCTSIHALSEKASLAKDEKMTELMKQKGDMHFFMNSEALNTGSLTNAALSMLNLSKLYKEAFTTGVANFENGQVLIDFKSYAGKEMTDISRKYSGTSINTDMIRRIPAKDVAVLFSMNFKPEGIREFLKLGGLDGFANMGTAFLGFNVDDFIKANKGDIAFCLSDIKTDTLGRPDMNVFFSAAIGDQNSFNKLIEAGKKLGREEMGNSMDDKVFYKSDKSFFAIGNNRQNIDQFIAGSAKNNLPFMDKISGNPIAAYINVQYLIRGLGEAEVKDSLSNIAYQASLNFWQDFIITGGKFHDGGVDQHIEINLQDKKTNSLKALNQYFSLLADVQNKKNQAAREAMGEPITIAEE